MAATECPFGSSFNSPNLLSVTCNVVTNYDVMEVLDCFGGLLFDVNQEVGAIFIPPVP